MLESYDNVLGLQELFPSKCSALPLEQFPMEMQKTFSSITFRASLSLFLSVYYLIFRSNFGDCVVCSSRQECSLHINILYVGPMHSAMPNREPGKQWKLMAQIHSLYIFYYQIAIYKTKILRIAEVKGIQNNEVGKRGLCKNCVSNKRFRPFKSIYKKYLNWGVFGFDFNWRKNWGN